MQQTLPPNNYQSAGFPTPNPNFLTSNENQLRANQKDQCDDSELSTPQKTAANNCKQAVHEASMDRFDISPIADYRSERILSGSDVDYLLASESGNSAKWSAQKDFTPIDKWDDDLSSTYDLQLSV